MCDKEVVRAISHVWDAIKELTEIVNYRCSWLQLSIDYRPVEHARAPETIERMGAGGVAARGTRRAVHDKALPVGRIRTAGGVDARAPETIERMGAGGVAARGTRRAMHDMATNTYSGRGGFIARHPSRAIRTLDSVPPALCDA